MLIQNEIKCKSCGDVIFSKHRHDFVTCKCGAVSVDGGMEYHRVVGDLLCVEDRCLYLKDEVVQDCIRSVEKSISIGRNSLGITLAVIRVLRDSGYFNGDKVGK